VSVAALIDTGWLAHWMATNKNAKIDEIVVVTFVLACAAAVYSMRRWLGLSYRLIKFEAALIGGGARALDPQASFRRDILGVSIAGVIAVAAVAVLDTGELAEWIASQSHTRVDEAIVTVFVLMIGLTFFSIRRWLELSQQLATSDSLYRVTTQLNHEATVLGELSDLLQSCRSSDEAYRLIATRAPVLFPHTSGAVCIIANSRDVVDVAATWGEPSLADRFFAIADCWALRRGRANIVGAHAGGVRCGHIRAAGPSRALCVPMMAQGEALGLLYLDGGQSASGDATATSAAGPPSAAGPADWSEAELRLAKTLSEQAALALANLSLRETLRLQSVRDPLTGLYNRRFLEESLERELRRSARKGAPLGVMMIDVDHFKRLNDTAGHDAGDHALRALADLFLTHVRAEDIVCRYGGEEFTMLLPDASLEATQARAESMRAAAAQLAIPDRTHTALRVTISIGVASSPEHGDTAEALLRAADAALYRAKESGRNRIVSA
jgi:diguanylate cyclase